MPHVDSSHSGFEAIAQSLRFAELPFAGSSGPCDRLSERLLRVLPRVRLDDHLAVTPQLGKHIRCQEPSFLFEACVSEIERGVEDVGQPLGRCPATLLRARGRDPLRRRSCSEATALTAREVRSSSAPKSTTRLLRLWWLIWRAGQWRDGPPAPRMVGETVHPPSAHSSRSERDRVGPLQVVFDPFAPSSAKGRYLRKTRRSQITAERPTNGRSRSIATVANRLPSFAVSGARGC
jgi:hypothetical protein